MFYGYFAPHWSYDGWGGPVYWGKLTKFPDDGQKTLYKRTKHTDTVPSYTTCDLGARQSPIDITSIVKPNKNASHTVGNGADFSLGDIMVVEPSKLAPYYYHSLLKFYCVSGKYIAMMILAVGKYRIHYSRAQLSVCSQGTTDAANFTGASRTLAMIMDVAKRTRITIITPCSIHRPSTPLTRCHNHSWRSALAIRVRFFQHFFVFQVQFPMEMQVFHCNGRHPLWLLHVVQGFDLKIILIEVIAMDKPQENATKRRAGWRFQWCFWWVIRHLRAT